VNGAALYFSGAEYSDSVSDQLDFHNSDASKGFLLRKVSAQIQRSTKIPTLSLFQFTIRMVRLLTTGSRLPRSTQESETELPAPAAPHQSVSQLINSVNPSTEVSRRQRLFEQVFNRVRGLDIEPIFDHVENGTSPYGFAFIADSNAVHQVRKKLRGLSVEVIHWPDLPDAVQVPEDHYYRNVWVVNFL
jgi:hypothetical protein